MPDGFLVTCPFCGEQLEIYVGPDVTGSFVQDCEVCCNPWRITDDERDGGAFRADARSADHGADVALSSGGKKGISNVKVAPTSSFGAAQILPW